MEGHLAMLFRDDDSIDDSLDDDEDDEEVWVVNEEWLMAPTKHLQGRRSIYCAVEGHSLALLAPGFFVPPA
ncbi:hypothetical protein Tco_0594352, partial [Tanacetum coccineum]